MVLRNEKTGRFESAKTTTQELTLEEQIKQHEEELAALKAKQAEKQAELAKQAAQEKEAQLESARATRKADAEVVKAAITARLEQETATRKAQAEAYKIYLEACDEAEKALQKKKETESKALNDFCGKYGSFHDTITVGDATYTCNYTNKVSYVDPFKKLLDFWF